MPTREIVSKVAAPTSATVNAKPATPSGTPATAYSNSRPARRVNGAPSRVCTAPAAEPCGRQAERRGPVSPARHRTLLLMPSVSLHASRRASTTAPAATAAAA